jgi:hypothetical protein
LGGILGFYAELRREIIWGKLNSLFFGVLFEVPRRPVEEGGNYVCVWGNLLCANWRNGSSVIFKWGDLWCSVGVWYTMWC